MRTGRHTPERIGVALRLVRVSGISWTNIGVSCCRYHLLAVFYTKYVILNAKHKISGCGTGLEATEDINNVLLAATKRVTSPLTAQTTRSKLIIRGRIDPPLFLCC